MRNLALIFALALTGCTTTRLPNGCVVDALSHRHAVESRVKLEGKTAFNEILLVSFTDSRTGHALSIFCHRDRLWAYDYARGSRPLGPYREPVSADSTAARIYPAWRVKKADWL